MINRSVSQETQEETADLENPGPITETGPSEQPARMMIHPTNAQLKVSLLLVVTFILAYIASMNTQLENEQKSDVALSLNDEIISILTGFTILLQHIVAMERRAFEVNRGFFGPSPVIPRHHSLPTFAQGPVYRLEEGSSCSGKVSGQSAGKVCVQDNDTWFLKKLEIRPGWCISIDTNNGSELICLEEFNRQFARNNIGIRVPETRFFVEEDKAGPEVLYIGSRKIEGMNDAQVSVNSLDNRNIAKLMVAKTFFNDMHSANWVYDQDGLICLIDVDSFHVNSVSIEDFVSIAITEFKMEANEHDFYSGEEIDFDFEVSLSDIQQMKEIYEEMREIQLPPYHNEFHMTNETYITLLDIFSSACDETIKTLENEENVYSGWILDVLSQKIRKVADRRDEATHQEECSPDAPTYGL